MRAKSKKILTLVMSVIMLFGVSYSAFAHLMVAQHGTVNIVDNGAFIVLSVPASAFYGVDEDDDGKVSMVEFNDHRAQIIESIRHNVVLSDNAGDLVLEGIMLSPEVAHDEVFNGSSPRVEQITVMGRFALLDPNAAISLFVGLYGTKEAEQRLQVTGTRRADNAEHVLVLSPLASGGELFPAWAMN